MRTTKTTALLAALALTIALAGCGSSGSDSGSDGGSGSGDDAGATSTTTDVPEDGPGRCGAYIAGEAGVLRTFCDGTATASVTVAGTEHELADGTCTEAGDTLSVNIGVVTGLDFEGELPDYFGANVPSATGDFGGEGVVLALQVGGEAVTVTDVTGEHDGDTATFRATTLDGEEVTGTFGC